MKIPLVFLSGLLSNQTVWDHQIRHLSDIAAIQVISPSQNTPEAILDAAPPQFALAGHSMGGWLCLEVMRAAPSRVTQLCLLNTTARSDTEEKKSRRQRMILETERGHFQEVVNELVEYLVFNSHVKQSVKNMFLDVGEEVFIRQEKAMLARNECQSVLSSIRCPTLVIHAAQDQVFSLEEHQELANRIQHAKLAVVENSGHMSPMEVPQAITALLRSFFEDAAATSIFLS
jgi:pimeloyl-ACP methyl ester carboxylesterase